MLEAFMDTFARPLWDRLDAILKAVTKPEYDWEKDEFTKAAQAGRLAENVFIGVGAVILKPSQEGQLRVTTLTDTWVQSVVLGSDSSNHILVKSIRIDKHPINIGSHGAPLSLFDSRSTRYGISIGRRFVPAGTEICIDMVNCDEADSHNASGALICSRLLTPEELAANAAGLAKLRASGEMPEVGQN